MRKPILVLLATTLFLAGCGGWSDSRVNPSNWFGNSRSSAVPSDGGTAANPLIPRARNNLFARPAPVDFSVLIETVTELRVDRTSTGATIYATGLAARQGAFGTSLRLVPADENSKPDVLSLTFRVLYPANATPVGPEGTRIIREAYSLSDDDLRGIRLIRVTAAQNTRETRRRYTSEDCSQGHDAQVETILQLNHPHCLPLGGQRNLSVA